MDDLLEASIAELQARMTRGEITSLDLVRAYLARIEAYDQKGPTLNAVSAINPDALEIAAALDAERAERGPRGPLHGIPIIVKDNYETTDMETSAGSNVLRDWIPPHDAFLVTRLREAGAVILAKATMHEFAYGITNIGSRFGFTRNPYQLDRVPGGSSGGTGAAVAANFAAAQQQLASRFEASTGVRVETSLGATGALYTQITSGAPYDVFLAADTARPAHLEADGHAVVGTRFTYAVGRLVLFAPSWDPVRSGDVELATRTFQHLAIANPRTAPYGTAARVALERWGLWEGLQDRIVRGENVGQAFQYVASGAAEVGFVALSQVVDGDAGGYWTVPAELHPRLRQDAVLLRHGERNAAARRFLEYLRTEEASEVMTAFGYERP